MRYRVLGFLGSAVIALGACGGGSADEKPTAGSCADRWNADGNTMRERVVGMWKNYGYDGRGAKAWLGPSSRRPDVCAGVIQIDARGASMAVRQVLLEGGDEDEWAAAGSEFDDRGDRNMLDEANARFEPDGTLHPE